MARLIKMKFKYISKKTIAIFMAIVVVAGYAVWQICNLTFNAAETNFVDAANANHWGRSDLRAFLNPTLFDGVGNKNYLVNSTAGSEPTEDISANSYEKYFKGADLEILRSGVGYTVETKNSATNVMEETKDRFWLPSGKDDAGKLYWGKEDISDESTKTFIKNDTGTGTDAKQNHFIPSDKVKVDSWLRSSTDTNQANTTNGKKKVTATYGVAPIFTISRNRFSFASIACGSKIADNDGHIAVGDYKNQIPQDDQIAMYLKKESSELPTVKDVVVDQNKINITMSSNGNTSSGDYYTVVCIYNDKDAHLYSINAGETSINRVDNLKDTFAVKAWAEKGNDESGTVNQVSELYKSANAKEFDKNHQLVAEGRDLHASWKLVGFNDSGAGQKIYLGLDDSENPIPFWICGEIKDDGKLITNGSYLVLYPVNSIYINIVGREYNKKESEYIEGEGGKGNIPTLAISDKDGDNHYTSYVGSETPTNMLTYTSTTGETPEYTWYNYALDENSDTSKTATAWTSGFPQEVGKYKVKASAGQTGSNAAVESPVVTFEVVPKLTGITVKNSQNSYVTEQKFKPDTLSVTAEFSDGSTKPVEGENITITEDSTGSNFDYNNSFTDIGSYTVTVTYTQKTDAGDVSVSKDVPITVTKEKLDRIEASAGSLSCIEGMELSTEGITVNAYYNSDPNKAVPIYQNGEITADGIGNLEFSPTKFVYSEESETQYLTVKYSEGGVDAFATLSVTVEKKKVESISVVSNPSKMEYIKGEEFNSAGLVVKAVYNNGDERLLGNDEYVWSTTVFDTIGSATVTITYTGSDFVGSSAPSTDIKGIKVNHPQVISIEVDTTNWNNSYISGQEFRTDGLVVESVYNNGDRVTLNPKSASNQDGYEHPENVTLGVEQCTISYTTFNQAENKYETFIAMVNVNVTNESFASIEVLESPTNKHYIVGQSFDPTGLVIGAKLTGASEDQAPIRINYFNPNFWTFEPNVFDTPTTTEAPTTSVKVTYKPVLSEGQRVSTDITGITVAPKQVTGISVVGQPTQIHYADGSQFKPDGLTIQATYNDGEIKTVQYSSDTGKFAFAPETLEFGDALQKDITVTYTDSEYGSASTTVTVYKVPKMVSELEIRNSDGVKKNYIEGQTFDPSNLAVAVHYTDGTYKSLKVEKGEGGNTVMPDGLSFRPDGKLTTADTKITISYTEGGPKVEGTINIIVEPKKLTSIDFAEGSLDAAKKDYVEGQVFDPTGLVVMGTYNDGEKKPLECKNGKDDGEVGYRFYPDGPLNTSINTIEIRPTVGNVNLKYVDITVRRKAPDTGKELKINRYPQKMEYIEGQTFDPTGLQLTVTYDNGDTKDVEVKNATSLPEGLTIASADPLPLGDQEVTVTYEEANVQQVTTLSISVRGKQVIGIEVNDANLQKTHYVAGEEFDPTGLVVYKVYNNGTKDEMGEKSDTNTDGYYYDDANLTFGVEKFPIYYDIISDGATETVLGFAGVEVTHRAFSSIVVSSDSQHKTEYIEGQPFDPTGLVITATLSAPITPDDGGTEITSVTIKNFSDGFWEFTPDPLETSTTSVNVAYKFGSQPTTVINGITVNKKELTSISVKNQPSNIIYTAGAEFNPDGLSITATYNDGEIKTVQYSSDTGKFAFTPETLEFGDALQKDITVTYTDGEYGSASTTLTVYKVPKMVSELEIRNSDGVKKNYIEGQTFDPSNLAVTVHYTDGTYKSLEVEKGEGGNTVIPDGLSFRPDGKLTTADTKITISYTEGGPKVEGTINIIVEPKELTSIDFAEGSLDAVKKNYVEGQVFDTTGLIVVGTYDNGDEEELECKNGTTGGGVGYTYYPDGGLTTSNKSVTISATVSGVETLSIPVTVEGQKPIEIEISRYPQKTEYIEGQKFDPTGLELTVKYNDGSTKKIEVTNAASLPEGLTIESADPLPSGDQEVTVTYEEEGVQKTTKLSISVRAKQVIGIEIDDSGLEKTHYVAGEEFDPTGLVVKAVYDNGARTTLNQQSTETPDGYYYDSTNLTYGVTKFPIFYDIPSDGTAEAKTVFDFVDVTVAHRAFSKIEVTTPPNKKEYVEGQSFDPTGLVITATLSTPITPDDGGTGAQTVEIKNFGDGFWEFTPDPLETSTTSVNVAYKFGSQPTTVINGITVNKKELTSISVKNQPSNIRYAAGAEFNPEGLVITANYNDGTSKPVEYSNTVSSITWNPKTLNFKDGEGNDVTSQAVTITYTDNEVSQSVDITVYKVPNVPSKLEILPESGNKTAYTEGEEFNPVGLRLKVTYTDGKEKGIIIASQNDLETNNVSYSPTGPLSAGTTEMTIEYTEPDRIADEHQIGELTVKSTQAITVTARTLDRIEITALPKVSYVEGEKFDSTGMVVTKYYDNGTSDTTTDYTLTYEDDGTPVEGELSLEDGRATRRTIKVTLNDAQDKTATFDIWIAVKIPRGLTINHDPKTNYVIGQSFDPTGLELTVTYDNGISETIAVTDKNNLAPGLSFVVADPLTANTNKVMIRFEKNGERIETELKITVEEKKVDYIYVANRPEKILYIEGETFNPDGMVVKSHYNDGDEIELQPSEYTYSTEPLQWSGVAEQDIEITYKEDSTKTAHQTVTVIQKTITGLEIKKGPDNTAYFVGESFDPTGMQINAIFNNGEVIPVYGEGAEDIGGELIITPSTLSYGDTRVMVSYIYNGIAVVTKQDVTVNMRLLDSINIVNPPKNLEYVEEESFDPEEMVVMAKYNDGFEEQIDNSNLVISPNPLTIDTKSVSIYYTSGNITKVAEQEILVRSIDEVYKRATLQDELKQALITGKFTEGAELVITRIEDDYELYTELYERLTEKSDVALLYDVSIVGGEYHGKLRLTFVVGEAFNGREITIIHKLASGEKEFLSGIVKNGRITVTVNELSPFLLALDTEEDNSGGSGSGDNNGGNSNSGNSTGGSGNNDGSGSGSSEDGSNVSTDSNILNTGDNSLAVVLGLIVTISICAVVILILSKKKSNK